MEELKACPFCGGRAVLHVSDGVCVICNECGNRTMTLCDGQLQGKYTSGAVKSVIKKWNKRVGAQSCQKNGYSTPYAEEKHEQKPER